MRLTSIACFVALISLATVTSGCDIKLGEDTQGEKGNLRFSYTGNGCFFGCGLDRGALQGSMVTISAEGGALVDGTVRAGITDGYGSVSSLTQSCTCSRSSGNTSTSHTAQPGEKCATNESRSCNLSVDVETTRAGDAKLEILDAKGKVIDRIDILIRPAHHIDVKLRSGSEDVPLGGDGVYEVKQGSMLSLESTVYDASDGELIFAKHGVGHRFNDPKVVKGASELFGWSDVQSVRAEGPGTATVFVEATGATKEVTFRVVP
jgi:hypothetical protein